MSQLASLVHTGMKPLLRFDVWEHAYSIDHRNARPDFAQRVLGNAVGSEFVASNFDSTGESRGDQPS